MAKTTVAHFKVTRDVNGTTVYIKSEALCSLFGKFANGRTQTDYDDPSGEGKLWYFSGSYPDMIHNYNGELYRALVSTKLGEGITFVMKTPTTRAWAENIAQKIKRDIEKVISEYSTVQTVEVIMSATNDIIRWNVPNNNE